MQDSQYIDAEVAYFSRSTEGRRERLLGLADLLGAPEPDPQRDLRVFIHRDGAKYGRGVTNMPEILPILARHDIQVIDPASMSFSEQMDVFSRASLVVGGHGAGLTNILFRRTAGMSLLELFPPNDTPLHFHVIAKALGHRYSFMVGDYSEGTGRGVCYRIDPAALDAELTAIDE